MSLPKPGNVILHTRGGDVEMPESEALPYKPQPVVEGNARFIWARNIPSGEQQLFRERLGDSVRFGNDAVSPIDGVSVPDSVGVFIRENHDYHVLKASDFFRKYCWV